MKTLLSAGAIMALFVLAGPDRVLAQPVRIWQVDPGKSRLEFAIVVSGKETAGRFTRWTANITFDPMAPGARAVDVTVDMASAEIDLAQAVGILGAPDWLASAAYPDTWFRSDTMTWQDGILRIEGMLTLRGETHPLALVGPLTIRGNSATADVVGDIDRSVYGMHAAPDAVANSVTVRAHIEADAAP